MHLRVRRARVLLAGIPARMAALDDASGELSTGLRSGMPSERDIDVVGVLSRSRTTPVELLDERLARLGDPIFAEAENALGSVKDEIEALRAPAAGEGP